MKSVWIVFLGLDRYLICLLDKHLRSAGEVWHLGRVALLLRAGGCYVDCCDHSLALVVVANWGKDVHCEAFDLASLFFKGFKLL